MEQYFKRVSDSEWIETVDGVYYARFILKEQKDDYVVLFKVDSGIYVYLFNSHSPTLGKYGKWIV